MSNPTPEQGPLPYGSPANYPQQPGGAAVPPPGAPDFAAAAPAGDASAGYGAQPGAQQASAFGAPAGPAAPGPRRSRRGRIIGWTAGGLVLAVGASVGGMAVVAQATQRGADTPQAAITRLDTAIKKKDKLELAKLLSAAEMKPMFENLKAFGKDSGLDKLQSKSGVPFGEMDQESVQKMIDAIDIKSSQMDFTVSEKSSAIALAELKSWKLDVAVDRAKLIDALVFAQQRAGQTDVDSIRKQLDDALPEDNITFNGDVVEESGGTFSIALVKEGDRWYVSPIMTAANAAYEASNAKVEPRWDADVAGAAGKGSPAEAVQAALETVRKGAGPEQILSDEFASLLALPERRAIMVYGPALLGDIGPSSSTPSRDYFNAEWRLSEYKVNDDLAVVGPGTSSVGPVDSDERITFDGAKLSAEGKTVDFGSGLVNPQRLGLATVKENGTWHVSLLDSITNVATFAGNQAGQDALKKFLESNSMGMGLKWDDLDERSRVNLSGMMFFLAPVEEMMGKPLPGSSSSPVTEGGQGGLPDDTLGYDPSESDTGFGSDAGSSLGTQTNPDSMQADLGKIFGSN